MLDRSLEEMRVTLLTTVTRRVGAPGDVFEPIDVCAALRAKAKLLGPGMDVSVELVRIVERRHHNVSTLAAIRVVAVVHNDPAGNGVIVWIHHGHAGSIRPSGTSRQRVEYQGRRRKRTGVDGVGVRRRRANVMSTGDRRGQCAALLVLIGGLRSRSCLS